MARKTYTTIYNLYETIAVRIPRDILIDSTFEKDSLDKNKKYPIEWHPETKEIVIKLEGVEK